MRLKKKLLKKNQFQMSNRLTLSLDGPGWFDDRLMIVEWVGQVIKVESWINTASALIGKTQEGGLE